MPSSPIEGLTIGDRRTSGNGRYPRYGRQNKLCVGFAVYASVGRGNSHHDARDEAARDLTRRDEGPWDTASTFESNTVCTR